MIINGCLSGVNLGYHLTFYYFNQIDIVIDRKDQVINICEMKFSIHPFVIDKKYAENLRNKMGTFQQHT